MRLLRHRRHSAIAMSCATAMTAIEARFDVANAIRTPPRPAAAGPAARRQIFGSVTPFCPWYLPPRSLYEVSHTSSDSKKITCATPSFA